MAHKDAIFLAATSGDVATLVSVLSTEGAVAVRMDEDPEELTTLHHAAAAGQLEVVKYLLSASVGSDACAARMNNFTPLHSAAMNGHVAVCEELLRAGAQVNVQTVPQGYTPLHSAGFAGHIDVLRVLLAHGGDRSLVNYRNERPSDTAKRQNQSEAAKLLNCKSAKRQWWRFW